MSTARSRRSSPRRPWAFLFGRAAGPRGRSLPRRGLEPAAGCERLEPRAVLAAAPPAPLVALVQDTGASATDRITSVAALAVTTVQDAAVEYSVDGGRVWAPSFAPLPGVNRLLVRQTAPGSGPSAATSFSFTFDDTAPAALSVSLKLDTGASGNDRVTRDGTLSFLSPVTRTTTVEPAATIQYWNGIKLAWEASSAAAEGLNTVKVRQVDRAGNASPESTLEFTLDRMAPVAPALSLANDTNVPGDRITSVGTLVAATAGPAAVEPTASVQYSTTGGKTWAGSFAPKTGGNAVLVRQVDLAGNASAPTTFTFTYDTAAPAAPQLALAADTGTSRTDRITADGTLSFANPTTKKSSLETGATVAYSVLQPDGVTWSEWSASFAPADGGTTVRARQVDRAGNVSAASVPLAFTLVRQPPVITAATAPSARTYVAGQTLDVALTFSRPVTVSPLSGGTAAFLDLTIGSASRRATCVSGSGTTTLVFRAAVASGDFGAVAVGGTVRLPTNAFIRDIAGNNASTTFTPPDTAGVLVDALVPVASMSFDPVTLSATIFFTRPVTGVGIEDFRIRGTVFGQKLDLPVTDPLIINTVGDVRVTGGGGQWTLSVESPPPGGGSLTLVLVAAGSGIVDAVGNPLKADASVTVSR